MTLPDASHQVGLNSYISNCVADTFGSEDLDSAVFDSEDLDSGAPGSAVSPPYPLNSQRHHLYRADSRRPHQHLLDLLDSLHCCSKDPV